MGPQLHVCTHSTCFHSHLQLSRYRKGILCQGHYAVREVGMVAALMICGSAEV